MKKYVCLTVLLSCTTTFGVTPYYNIRSQSFNTAREIVGAGWNSQINLCDMDKWYGNFSITTEYTQSFNPKNIVNCLFGPFASCYNPCRPSYDPCKSPRCKDSCCFQWVEPQQICGKSHMPHCTCCNMPCCDSCCEDSCGFISIAGSHVANRQRNALLADYFGLPTDYQSVVCFKPEISNFLVECSFYVGLDEWLPGLYLKFRAPIVHTRWDLNMSECIIDEGKNNYLPGYFNSTLNGTDPDYYGIQRLHLVPSFTAFITGCSFINVDDIRFLPLAHAKMNCSDMTKTTLADLRMEVGWDFLCNNNYTIGINIEAAGPTGNRPEGFYLFEPIVGNGKHWEVGASIHAFWDFYTSEDECTYARIYGDARFSHLFKTKQVRTFDLCGRPLSRYMLAGEFVSPIKDLNAGPTAESAETPSKQFQGIYEPLANLTTFSVDVGISGQADITMMLQYVYSNISLGLGYSFWGRTCEDIEFRCDCPCQFDSGMWGLKGDAFMYGFKQNITDESITSSAVALSATQSHATICKGTNNPPNGINNLAWSQNPGIDNKQLAWDDSNDPLPLLTFDPVQSTTVQAYTSLDPILLELCDINLDRSGTKGMSHKLFAHIDYRWENRENWIPYVGFGGEVEFGHNDACCNDCNDPCCSTSNDPCYYCCPPCGICDESCRCCTYCSLSQWGVWVKGGVAFH